MGGSLWANKSPSKERQNRTKFLLAVVGKTYQIVRNIAKKTIMRLDSVKEIRQIISCIFEVIQFDYKIILTGKNFIFTSSSQESNRKFAPINP